MNKTVKKTYGSYVFGTSWDLSDQDLDQLIRIFNMPTDSVSSVLGGRSSVANAKLKRIGPVVIKYYTRGGFIRHIVKRKYMKWGKTRCQIEYEALQRVRRLGISAPEPIVFAYKGALFYKAWLVTREIKHKKTLAELSRADVWRARSAMKEVVVQVATLIKHNIFHPDLHPGNILVDSADCVFFLDFDKTRLSRWKRHKLRDKYVMRWQRAVTKHQLPEMLCEIMSSGFQKNYGLK